MDDNATVPLYYENRIPELQLTNPDLNRDMAAVLEDAELDEAQEARLEREFAREYHLITRADRLDADRGGHRGPLRGPRLRRQSDGGLCR